MGSLFKAVACIIHGIWNVFLRWPFTRESAARMFMYRSSLSVDLPSFRHWNCSTSCVLAPTGTKKEHSVELAQACCPAQEPATGYLTSTATSPAFVLPWPGFGLASACAVLCCAQALGWGWAVGRGPLTSHSHWAGLAGLPGLEKLPRWHTISSSSHSNTGQAHVAQNSLLLDHSWQ